MSADLISGIVTLVGASGILVYTLKDLANKIDRLDTTKLDQAVFQEHLKNIDDMRGSIREMRVSMDKSTELLARIDGQLSYIHKDK